MFVDDNVIKRVMNCKSYIEEEEVEVRPECISPTVLDENVDYYLIRKYFTSDAWLAVENTIKEVKESVIYICKVCSRDIGEDTSVGSDHCLNWFHLKCIGKKLQPKSRYWFCFECYKSCK